MAKTMKFKDDKTYGFADSSTALDCVAVVKTFAELDAIRAEFTEDNLKGGDAVHRRPERRPHGDEHRHRLQAAGQVAHTCHVG